MKVLTGTRHVGKRLSAFVEMLGDDTEDGVTRIKEALEYLGAVIAEREREISQKKKAGPGRKR